MMEDFFTKNKDPWVLLDKDLFSYAIATQFLA